MTRRKYSGKYPHRIRAFWTQTMEGKQVYVFQTNDGLKYAIKPVTAHGRMNMPKLGHEVWEYTTTTDYEGIIL